MADLNTQIMEAIQNYSDLAPTIKQRYSDQPAYEAETRETLFGNDQGLSSAMSGFSDKVKELYTYDQSKATERNAAANQMTTQAGEVMPVNPMIQERANQQSFMQTVDEKEKAWQLYETRKNILGDVLDKAIKKYEAETNMKLVDKEMLGEQIKMLKDMYSEEQQNERQARDLASAERIAGIKNNGGSSVSGGIPEIDALDDNSAISLLKSKLGNTVGSNDVLGGTGSERGQRARDLLTAYYSGNLSLNEILTAKETAALDDALATKTQMAKARNTFAKYKDKGVAGGTGPLAGILPTKLSSKLAQELRADIGEIQTKMQKFYSGVAISAQEMQRLEQFLPSKDYDEAENYRRLTKLENGMNINQAIFELARLTGRTTNEVLMSDDGRKIFEENGENYPYGESSIPKYKVTVKQ